MNIKSIIHNKNVKNGIWLYLLQIFNTIVPMLTIPYITRILGAEKYGTFSIVLNIIGYLQVLVEYGFGMSATRDVSVSDKKNESINYIFTSVLFSRVLLFFSCIIFSIIFMLISHYNITQILAMIIMLCCLLGYCVQTNWLFQGMQEMKYISLVNITARSVSTIGIFCFVKGHDDLLLYCFLYSVSPLLSGFLGLFLAKIKYKIKLVKISFSDIVKQLKRGGYVFTTQLSSKVFGTIGVTFLGILATEYVVGIFSAIQKLPSLLLLAWSPISQVIYPIISSHMKNSFKEGYAYVKKIQLIILPIFSIIATIIAIFSKIIVRIAFGVEYSEFFYWSIPLLFWMVLSINNNLLGIQTLLASGYDKQYSKCFQIGVICTIIINYVMIYFKGGFGAAIAPALAEGVLCILLINEIKKIKE